MTAPWSLASSGRSLRAKRLFFFFFVRVDPIGTGDKGGTPLTC